MMRHSVAALLVLAVGCSFDSSGGSGSPSSVGSESGGNTTETPTTETTTSTTSVTSSVTASTSSMTTMTGNPTTATTVDPGDTSATEDGTGSSTGDRGGLVKRGLVTRYFIDEASEGQVPQQVIDHSGNGVDLDIEYDTNMNYDEVGGQRGLRWATAGGGGVPATAVGGTAIEERLEGSTEGTIEVVVDVEAVIGSTSRLSHIGSGGTSDFTLASNDPNDLAFRLNQDDNAAHFPIDLDGVGRCVLHLVFDSTADPADRARLFHNGSEIASRNTPDVAGNEVIAFPNTPSYVIGNRQDGTRSFQGRLFYAALYAVALTPEELQQNADALGQDDDAP